MVRLHPSIALIVLGLALATRPAPAAVTNCTTQMVSGGLCASTSDVLLSYSIPSTAQARVLDGLAAALNYQGTVPCSATSLTDEGILIEAGPGQGTCTVPLAGTTVANPQTKASAADAYVRLLILREIRRAESAAATSAAAAGVEATPTPVVHN